jgi:hypothetical protein
VNEGVRVVVHSYAGDVHQVRNALRQYQHHEAPVVVLSPEDAPVEIEGTECRSAGLRAYTGRTSLERQKAHLELLLEYPEDWFLLHDSDSVCLEPKLPEYLYEPDTVFYNAAPTMRYLMSLGDGAEEKWGDIVPNAFQPPLFMSRQTLEKLLAVADRTMPLLPEWAQLIDWHFAVMTQAAGLRSQAFPDGISRPIWAVYEIARVYASVRTRGIIFLHSVKTKEALDIFVTARAEYNLDPDGEALSASW